MAMGESVEQPRGSRTRCAVAAAVMLLVVAALWLAQRIPRAAPSQVIVVPATTDIWLAGQPDGATLAGDYGTDRAPAQSPVLVGVSAGHILTFAASGRTSVDGSCFAETPDGGCYPDESHFGAGPANGISTYNAPASALIGVFLDDATPSGKDVPSPLHFIGSERGFAKLAPALRQVFCIDDGLTGTGRGARQQFIVAAGATRLFLAVSDSIGGSAPEAGNIGRITATMTDVTGHL